MAILSRKHRIKLIKFLALLSIVRWPNVLLTALAQYMSALWLFNPHTSRLDVLADGKLHFIVLATACILAAGFIINSFYDIEKDLVNRPNKTLFDRVVSKSFCLRAYFVLNTIGLIFSALGSLKILVFFSFFIFSLWFYSHKLQKIPFVREFSASLLSVAAFFSVGYHYDYLSDAIDMYAGFMLQILFIREIVKDFRHFEGDKAAGYRTVRMVLGEQVSKFVFLGLNILALSTLSIFVNFEGGNWGTILFVCVGLMMVSANFVLFFNKKEGTKWAHRLWKIVLAISLAYLPFV